MVNLPLPSPNRVPGDTGHTSDTNLIINYLLALNAALAAIPAGPQGIQGIPGVDGSNGMAATVTVGSTVTGVPGSSAAVTMGGTDQARILNFVIPQGVAGPKGDTGGQGPMGPTGPAGEGFPAGGLAGQTLAKHSDAPYDTEWIYPPTAPVVSVDGRQGVVSLTDLYDAAGAAVAAQTAAQAYADSLAPNYDAAGAATTAQAAAQTYTDTNFIPNTLKGAAAGVATLDGTGKVPSTQLPAIALTTVTPVVSEAAMLALTAQAGDVAVRTDVSKSFMLMVEPATVLANWQELLSPPNAVTSVDGRVGTVSLTDLYDAAGAAATVQGNLTTHTSATTGVHGITDTANLVYQIDLMLKAPLASPAFTGVPTVPTATPGTNTTQAASTAFVASALSAFSGLPSQTGNTGKYLTTDGTTASWAKVTTNPTPTVFLMMGA